MYRQITANFGLKGIGKKLKNAFENPYSPVWGGITLLGGGYHLNELNKKRKEKKKLTRKSLMYHIEDNYNDITNKLEKRNRDKKINKLKNRVFGKR